MPMSTYLVAFVVGPLEATEPVQVPLLGSSDSIPLRIVHVPGKGHLTAFGLDVGAAALGWYQQYYGIPYPTDKCDMLALPDFAAGAMENLGCITYRENLLLCDIATSTQAEQQILADVVTHELAHMWFGDLVTMKWWNGIWLNEAFATFMEIACCDAYRPDWKRWTTFSLERSVAFETDSLASTRSVEFPVEAPADCDGMFDVLTYQKGGALLRMLEQYIGEDEFRNGVSHYLRTHIFGNTETSDLWDAIEEANPATPVRRLMDSWIWQPGYPLLTVKLAGRPSRHRAAAVRLRRQRRPHAVGRAGARAHRRRRVEGAAGHATRSTLPLPSADAVVVVNAGGHGFVRVAYDDALRARLVGDAVSQLTTIDRYNLVDDAWNAVVAGRLGAMEFVDFVEGFGAERDLAVWQAMAVGLRGVGRLVEGEAYDALPCTRPRAGRAGPGRAGLGAARRRGRPDRQAARPAGRHHRSPGQRPRRAAPVQSRSRTRPRACTPNWSPRPPPWSRPSAAPDEYDHVPRSLPLCVDPAGAVALPVRAGRVPHRRSDPAHVRLRDERRGQDPERTVPASRCIANRDHGRMAWDFVRRHWAEANEKFPINTIVRMIDPVKMLNRGTVVADVQSFFSEHPIPQAAKTLDQVLERQRVNAALREREEQRLVMALAST